MNYQFVLLFWSLLAAVSVDGCGVGWVQHNNLCYQVVAKRADWLTARQNCHTKGGDLVVIPNQETASFLNETLAGVQGSHWIGLHTRSTSPDFVWVDDLTNVTEFSNWAPAQPNYSSFSSEECVYISSGSGLWYSASCDWLSYPYICQREMGILPKCDVVNGWRSHNGKCYKVLNEKLKWQSAEESCASYPGGHLASASSHDDVMFITNMWVTSGSSFWIGLSDKNRTVAGDYVWSDGSTYTAAYTNWENSQPNSSYFGDGGDCAVVGEEGEWRIRRCTASCRHLLCAISEGTCAQGWHIVNGHCYQVNSYARKTWTDAKRHCEAQDGYLVTVQGSFETTLIQGFLPDLTDLGVKTLFIGISDQKEDGVFRWVDDAPTTYDNWAPSQPMNTNHTDCGYIFTGNLAAEWMTGNCFELGAYICEISAGVPVNPVPPEMETGKCEPGWALHGNFCYEFSLEKQTWADANTSCVNLGSQLASIHGDREQSFFSTRLDVIQEDVWIGLHDTNVEGNFYWTDGTAYDYQNWRTEPESIYNDCVRLRGERYLGMWEPTNCWRSYRYVCKKKKVDDGTVHTPSPPPTSDYELRCGMGWEYDASTNTCYVFRPHLFENWHDALYQCRVEGGDLISVTGPEDQQFIRGHLHNSGQIYTWMGCNDLGREGGWEWSDNSPFAFINWNAGQPDNGGGASPLGHHCCSFFSNSGTWVDHQCEQEQGYSCKRKAYILKYYSTSTQRKLPDHSDLTKFWYNVWPKDCAHICLHVTTCLSFDYRREHRSCYLSSLDAVSAGGLVTTEPGDHYDYYERDLTVPSPTRPPPLPSEYNCPPDWGRYDGHCYSLNTTKMDLFTAESSCRSVGAELATIEDRNTNNFIRGYMHEVAPSENRIWIGLSDRTLEGWFSWSGGEPVTFTNWDSGQPDNGDENDCTEMHIDSGYWRDTKCTGNYLSALCRKPIDLAPPPPVDDSCPDGWIPWMDKCYLANQTRAAWADAASMCSTEGGQLVVIEDGYELAFLSGVLGLKRWDNYFIGLSDLASRGYYQWIDQSEVTFTNWASGQPDDSTGNCVTMKSGSDAGYWSDRSCEKGYLFICEKSRIGWPTITLPTANPPTQPSDVGCSPGWIGYGDNCFKPFEISSAQDGSTWVEAYTACGSFGASLASFHHPNEERHIIDSFTPTSDRGFWIGLNDWRNEGGYEWSDGSVVQYTYWHTGQPNDSGGREQCVLTFLSTTTGWFDAPCYQKLNFICKMPKGIELRTTSAPTLSPGEPCADDPTWIHRYPYCYFFSSSFEFDGVQDWHHAEAWCQAKNSHLVSIHDSAELSFLLEYSQLFASYFWIGLRENGSYAGHYEWSDGSLLDFENWRSGQPDDMNGEEQCVEMQKFFSSPPGCWSDNNCGVQRQFICKRNVDDPPVATPAPTEVPVGGCPTGWWKHNHRCYMIGGKTFNTRKTWHDARAECQKTPGANLASIHNDNIQTLLAAFLTTTEYDVWIGLSSLGTSGRFLWNDGSSFDYENWGYNEPDGSNSQNSTDCVKLMNEAEETGKWNDEDCSKRNSYVCLMKPDPTIPETNFTLPACPYKPGYIYNGKACFKLDTSKLRSMGEAKQYCADDGATVASILNGYEQALLQAVANEYANGSVWLGLEKDPTTNTLKWIDGWPLHYSNWGWGSPNGADCAIMAKREWFWEDGEWMTVGCVFPRYTACKIATALPPTPHPTSAGYCPPGWKEFGSGCYVVPSNIFNQKSFPEARYDCQFSRGADLVMIDSQAENQFVRQLAEERFGLSEILLGLHRNTHGGWDWIDGTPASYVNWGSERPATVSQNCAMMHLDSQGKWFGTSCFAENHYMCEKPKIPYSSTQVPTVTGHVTLSYSSTKVPINATGRATLPPLSPPTGIATTVGGVLCTSGWIARGDYCYYIETGNRLDWLTWSEADAFCNNHGGHLTSIHSFAENYFIRSHTSPVSLTQPAMLCIDGFWSDKTEFHYDNWNSGEPNDHAGEEKCVEMYPTSGKWNDMACGIPQPFICKKLASNNDSIPVPSPYPLTGGCEDDWYRLGYQCYKLFGDSVSSPALPYREARDDCIDRGGNLASVSSQDVQIFLTALMDQVSSTHCWMGLNRLVDDFHWTDGSRLNFTNWAPGNPALQGGCVHMLKGNITTSGQWANIEGSANESYICQKPLDKNRPDTWIDIPCDIPGYSSFGQTCYKVDSTPNSYNEAELNCHGDPGTLASIGNRFEEALIRSALTYHGIGDAWIGLKRDNSGTFSWLNENQLSYVNWNHNEPSSREGEGCVRMLPGKVWDNTACSSKRASVCQIGGVSRIPSTSATPRYCGMAGWEQDGSECLLFNTGLTRVSRDEAQEKCKRAYGAVLPAVHSDEQNEFIRSNARTDKPLSSGRVWLQIYRNSKGDFVYNDTEGSKVDYVNWAIGQPDGQSVGADCVAMDVNDGKWSDEFCDVRKADCVCRLPTSEGYPKTELPYTSEFETGKPGTLSPKPQTGGLSGGAIVGIVIAVIIVVVAGLVAAYLFLGRWRGKGNFMEDRDVMSTTGFENAAYFSNIEVDATTT